MSAVAAKDTTPPERKWDGIIRRTVDFELREINNEERSLEVVCSTDTLDSHGDIVEQTFDLKRYKKNPVVLWYHNAFGWFDGSDAEDFLTIGRADGVKIEDGKLVAKLFFVVGSAAEEPLVDKIWRRIQQRMLRAVSIGFRPGKVTRVEENEKVTYRLSNNELYEISVVPIPSNPDAVAKAHAFEHEQLRRLAANDSAPEREAEEEDMDVTKLQAELDKVKGELAVANADCERAEKALKNAEGEAKLATDKANTEIKALTDKCSGLDLKCTEIGAQLKQLSDAEVTRKAAEQEATQKAEAAAADTDVDAVVGKKIAPTAREKWLAIRLRSKSEFDGLLADMPELPHLKQIVPPGTTPPGGGGGQSLIDEAKSA